MALLDRAQHGDRFPEERWSKDVELHGDVEEIAAFDDRRGRHVGFYFSRYESVRRPSIRTGRHGLYARVKEFIGELDRDPALAGNLNYTEETKRVSGGSVHATSLEPFAATAK